MDTSGRSTGGMGVGVNFSGLGGYESNDPVEEESKVDIQNHPLVQNKIQYQKWLIYYQNLLFTEFEWKKMKKLDPLSDKAWLFEESETLNPEFQIEGETKDMPLHSKIYFQCNASERGSVTVGLFVAELSKVMLENHLHFEREKELFEMAKSKHEEVTGLNAAINKLCSLNPRLFSKQNILHIKPIFLIDFEDGNYLIKLEIENKVNKILANGVDFKKSVNGLFAEIKRIESTAVPVDKVAEVLEITVYKKLGMGKEILYGTGTVSITTILLAIEPNTQFNQKFKPNALFKPIYIKIPIRDEMDFLKGKIEFEYNVQLTQTFWDDLIKTAMTETKLAAGELEEMSNNRRKIMTELVEPFQNLRFSIDESFYSEMDKGEKALKLKAGKKHHMPNPAAELDLNPHEDEEEQKDEEMLKEEKEKKEDEKSCRVCGTGCIIF